MEKIYRGFKISSKREKSNLVADLPKDHVYLGFKLPHIPNVKNRFSGYRYFHELKRWQYSNNLSGNSSRHYAAHKDSDIARKILGHEFEVGDEVKNITTGKIYVIKDIRYVNCTQELLLDNKKVLYWDRAPFFTLHKDVKEKFTTMSIEEQIKLALSLVGKRIKKGGSCPFTVEYMGVASNDYQGRSFSESILNHINKQSICVYVGSDTLGMNIPVADAVIVPDEEVVKLNETYSAIVTKDAIVVGCQTFNPDILKTLKEAHTRVSQ